MKKLITLSLFSLSASLFSQTFSVYKTNNTGVNTVTITNGFTLNETTTANGILNTKIKIKNNAASTTTYNVVRSLIFNAPALDLSGGPNKPTSYFCFGYTCFPNNVNSAGPSDYTILAASGQTSTTFPTSDNSTSNGQPFSIYLEEGTAVGNYVIRYKVFNVNNANDTLAFNVAYNAGVGIKKHTVDAGMVTLYPNPSSGEVTVDAYVSSTQPAAISIYNSLGELVKVQKQNLEAGRNSVKLNTTGLSGGLYNVVLDTQEGSVTKKLTISK